jgi:hypothetical protein
MPPYTTTRLRYPQCHRSIVPLLLITIPLALIGGMEIARLLGSKSFHWLTVPVLLFAGMNCSFAISDWIATKVSK